MNRCWTGGGARSRFVDANIPHSWSFIIAEQEMPKLRYWHCWTMGERPDKWLCWTKLMPTYEGHEAHIQNNMQNLHLCARSHGTQCVFIDQARRAAWICLLIWCSCHGWRALHHWHVMGAFSGRCCALHPCNV